MQLPKLDLKKIKQEINDLSREAHDLKKFLRHKTSFDSDFYSANKRLIECKRRVTFLCTLRAHYGNRIHLLNQLEATARNKFILLQLTYPERHITKEWLVEEMFRLQDYVIEMNYPDVSPFVVNNT